MSSVVGDEHFFGNKMPSIQHFGGTGHNPEMYMCVFLFLFICNKWGPQPLRGACSQEFPGVPRSSQEFPGIEFSKDTGFCPERL